VPPIVYTGAEELNPLSDGLVWKDTDLSMVNVAGPFFFPLRSLSNAFAVLTRVVGAGGTSCEFAEVHIGEHLMRQSTARLSRVL
jgi:hypothetical protein